MLGIPLVVTIGWLAAGCHSGKSTVSTVSTLNTENTTYTILLYHPIPPFQGQGVSWKGPTDREVRRLTTPPSPISLLRWLPCYASDQS
jgi:hypothetical protein